MLGKCSWLSQIQPKRNCPNLMNCVWDIANFVVEGSMSIYLPTGSRELIYHDFKYIHNFCIIICLYSQAWAWPGQTAWHHGQADQYHSPTLMFGAITIIIVCASLYIYLMCLLHHFLFKTVTHSTDCFLDPTELLCIQSRFRGSGRQEVQYTRVLQFWNQ